MLVVCVNNHTYGMTGGQVTPTTPEPAVASTTPYGAFEHPFNLPYLADSCGAVFVSRWTTFHVRQIAKAMRTAFSRRGFRFIEIISPCPTLYARRNRLGDGLDAMKYYKEKSVVKSEAATSDVGIDFQGEIICGNFVDRERETWIEAYNKRHSAKLGERFTPYPTGITAA